MSTDASVFRAPAAPPGHSPPGFSPPKVLKFGGTSVGSAPALEQLLTIVAGESDPPVVVVSALSGVTNALEALIDAAFDDAQGGAQSVGIPPIRSVADGVDALRTRHLDLARAVLPADALREYQQILRIVLGRLELRLAEITALGSARALAAHDLASDRDAVLSVGERLSAPLDSLALGTRGVPSTWVDSRRLILTDDSHGAAVVDLVATGVAVRAWYSSLAPGTVPILTGYIGRSITGRTTTLGRGGSDYSAALIAEALSARKLDRWTDVDGIHTANPRLDPSARRFSFLLAEDASTWNAAKALGMHEQAFDPVVRGCIPVHVRSTLHPHGDGTLILPRALPDRIGRDAHLLKHGTPAGSPAAASTP
jgi:aspartate kinase